ncbi:EFR1 family ferrodoxin [archaeon]|nr:EFR1 family ferrodoxin [archaeon]
MKGIICYYSGSGNTLLACQYLKSKIKNVDFELYDIVKNKVPDFSKYDVVGFATFADFGDIPQYFCSFFDKIPPQSNKNAFVFNTCGFLSGRTLQGFADKAKTNGFNVLSGYSLHTPESYPPMRNRRMPFDNSPKPKDIKKFNDFISRLDILLGTIKAGQTPENEKIKIGFLNSLLPKMPRTKAKEDMGKQKTDENLCIACGTCEKVCPSGAVHLKPKPVFSHDICCGCWACYNHCPKQAIHTEKYKGTGQYPHPNDNVKQRLKV